MCTVQVVFFFVHMIVCPYSMRMVHVCLCNILCPMSVHFRLAFCPQRKAEARQDYSHYIFALVQADGKTDDPHSSHSWPSIFISWLLAHRLHTSITSPQEPWQWVELLMRPSVWKTKQAWKKGKQVKMNTRMEKKKKKLWMPRRKTAVLVRVYPSELLNNFTLIKDNSKSMCYCELLFMTKGPGQCRLTWFIWLLWVPINERSDWPSEQLDRMSLHSLPLISCYLQGEMCNRSLRHTQEAPYITDISPGARPELKSPNWPTPAWFNETHSYKRPFFNPLDWLETDRVI